MKFTARVSASIHYSTWRWCSFLWKSKLLDKEPVNNFQLAAPMGTVPMGVILLRLRQKEFKYQCSRSFKLLYVHLKKIVKKNIFRSVFLTHLKRQRGPACTQCTPSSSQYGPIWREDVLCCICCYTTDPKYRIFQATNNKIKQSVPLTKASTAKQVLFHTWDIWRVDRA